MEHKSHAELPEKPLPPEVVGIDFWPHPLTTDGRCVIVAEPGKTLHEVLAPHLSLDQPAVATINGELLVKERWGDVVLCEGDIVQVRLTVADGGGGSNPIAVVLSLAVLVAAPYLAGYALTGQFGGFGLIAAAETALGQVITAAIGIGGILIVNALFPPRLPDTGGTEDPKPQYSISGGANRARPYEPLQLLLGQHRLFPDLAAQEYTEYDQEGDQFLNQIFEFGLGGNLDIENIRIGETLLLASAPAAQQVPSTETAPSDAAIPDVPHDISVTHAQMGMGGVQTTISWKAPVSWGSGSNRRYGRRHIGGEVLADITATSWTIDQGETSSPRVPALEIRAETDDGESAWVKVSDGPAPSGGAPAPSTSQGPPPLQIDSPNFEGVQMQAGVTTVDLVNGNVDTIAGGDFETQLASGRANGTPYISRTTASETTAIAFDLVSQHFEAQDDGELVGRTAFFELGWKQTGTSSWQSRHVDIVTLDGGEARNAIRRSVKIEGLQAAAYDLRVRLRVAYDESEDIGRTSFRASCPQMRAYQNNTADFTGRNPLALRSKASGQFYGRIETINADGAQLIPAWNGSSYVADQRTSNPADLLAWWLRGYRIGGRLVFGYGLSDDEIDFTAIQQWHAFCVAEGLECNIVIQDARDEDTIAQLICQCGWGRFDISSGKYGVIWENDDQPVTAVVTPSNIVTDSISAGYDNENLADEIIGGFIDRESDFKDNELRRPVPNPTITGEFPVTIPLEGITDGTHAAKEINRTAAAQFYHQRIIGWEMTEEGFLGINVGDVVGMANGLVGNGTGGRLMRISADRLTVEPSFEVEDASGECWVWLLDGGVLNTTYTRQSDGQILLAQALPAAPKDAEETPYSYRIMVFDSSAPYTKVRITGIVPAGPGRFRYQARDEVEEFYAARVADLTHELIPVEAPYRPCPEGFEVSETAIGVRIATWKEPTVPTIGFHLRYGPPGTAWGDMRELHDGLLTGSPWEAQDVPSAGTWRFGLVAVYADRADGNGGRPCEVVYTTATLGRPPRPVSGFEEVEVYRVVAADADPPERPTGGQYDFRTATLTPPDDWVGPRFPTFTKEQVVYASTATADSAEGNIWTPDEDDWSEPVVVGDADDLNVIYRRFDTPPTEALEPSAGIPEDWHDLVENVPDGTGTIYVSIGVRRRGSGLYAWGFPTQLEGQDGTSFKELVAYRVQNITVSPPARPGESGSYNFDDGTFTAPTGFVNQWPTHTSRQVIYGVATTAHDNDGRLWEAGENDWSPPVIVVDEGDINLIYRRYTAAPSFAPTESAGVPSGWYDRVSSVPAGAGLIYVSMGVRAKGVANFTWDLPVQLEGQSGTDGMDGLSAREVTIFQKIGKSASLPATPSNATWNQNTATLSNLGSWANSFPAYNPDTERVACSLATVFSDNTVSSWSTVRICDEPGDLNAVYRRVAEGVTPSTPSDSTGIPSGWVDVSSSLTGTGLAWISIGHRAPFSNIWTWSTPTRVSALDGEDGEDGRGIVSVSRDPDTGVVTITYDDGFVDNFTLTDAEDGTSITANFSTNTAGDVTVTFSDGTSFVISAGQAGRGITSIMRNSSTGVVTIAYDDGSASATFLLEDGMDGLGITSVDRSNTGLVTITFTDGDTDTFQVDDGQDGQSVSISQTQTLSDGTIRLTFTDGTIANIPPGAAGADGIGVMTVTRNLTTGIVTVTLDDGTIQTFPLDDGMDGLDGSSQEWIYRATTTSDAPPTPSNPSDRTISDYVPTAEGWNDDPVEGVYTWVSTRKKPAGTNTTFGDFSPPVPHRGAKGDPGEGVDINRYYDRIAFSMWDRPNGGYEITSRSVGQGQIEYTLFIDQLFDVDFSETVGDDGMSVDGVVTGHFRRIRTSIITQSSGSPAPTIDDFSRSVSEPAPAAMAGSIQISPLGSLAEDDTHTFAVTPSGGTYDTVSYVWSVVSGGGSIDASTGLYDPPDVSVHTTVRVRCTATFSGTGTNAQDGSSATATDDEVFTVTPVTVTPDLPDAVAGTITIPDLVTLPEDQTHDFSVSPSGGTYDTVDYAWSVVSSGGSIDASTGLYSPADVSVNTTVRVRCTATFSGTGTNARSGSSATATDDEFFVVTPVTVTPDLPDAVAGSIQISPLGSLAEDDTHTFAVTPLGGTYDTVSYVWSVEPGSGGSIGSTTGFYDPADVSANTGVTIRCTATFSGTGTNARSGSSATATDTEFFTVTPVTVTPDLPDAVAGTITISPLGSLAEDDTHTFAVTPSGGTYDDVDYAWSVVSGGGSIDASTGLYSPADVSVHTTVRVRCTATFSGTGTNARSGTSDTDTDDEFFTVAPVTVTPDLPDAVAGSIQISPLGSLAEDDTHTFAVTPLGGTYDTVSYVWSVEPGSGGSIGSTTGFYDPADVSANTGVTIRCTATFSGTGTNARSGTSATATDTEFFTVTPVTVTPDLPDAVAGSITISPLGSLAEDDTHTFAVTPSGGTYDTVSYAWIVWLGGGAIGASTGLYDPPNVSSNMSVTVRCTATFSGTGTNARSGTSATATDDEVFTVTPVAPPSMLDDAVAPTVTIDPLEGVIGGTNRTVRASVVGGTYDELAWSWSVSPGSVRSQNDFPAVSFATWVIPNTPGAATVSVTVTASGTGMAARSGTSASASDTESTVIS